MNIIDLAATIIWEYMWGMPLVLLLMFAGAWMTYKSGFFQFRYFKRTMKYCMQSLFGRKSRVDGQGAGLLNQLQATSMALGTTIGVGNIGGVATAIAVGGPGAVFWMWISGLFGMALKMSEITLAVHYRNQDDNGETYGGPTYYIEKGIKREKNLKNVFKILNTLFITGALSTLVINIQTYTVSEAIGNTFGISMVVVAVIYTALLYLMIGGGIKGLGKIAGILVPIMCLFYFVVGIFIIIMNINLIPGIIIMVVKSAFTGTAAFGGFMGAAVMVAIKTGISRSVFSNEAGWGTAAMIHSTAKVDHPVKQGMLGVFEVFVDTFVICSITCFVILISGEWSTGLDGATLTLAAFESQIGYIGRVILAISVFIFGLTTSSGVYAQLEVVLRYIVGDTPLKVRLVNILKLIYPIPSLAMVLIAVYYGFPGTTLWLLSDGTTVLPIFANCIALLILSRKFTELTRDYVARYIEKKKPETEIRVFYVD
ncbi:alanine or glycine:cation symporter, AGCS family [Dethiosulfatibacter aminovorans DSM 17477]|uniref:Alanine or glycine:cation symporter, AGCS family n=1 Tax=Dethiosulfatibacter aminovorans DSM 17477 TaxID=1121476 RepID=A0A1M6MJG1_9FIRM|nr:amino acid carrier protein [Dethiosulfatibacter aminovorans]SHJ83621.1 alanine or glycine:cation symporter, AGCS family [Dethiosulfatibacter aminovorans DSM 17477]